MAGAAWLRLHDIAAKSFWIDEGASVAIARMDWFNFARLLWRREANMTLYYLVLRPWLHVGESEAWVRGLSVVFALATFPVIYLLGKRLFGRRTGMVACVLLAVNAFHVRYSQEARTYTLVMLLVSVASLMLVEAVWRPKHWKWTAYAIIAALAVYAQFYAVLVIVAHAVWWWRSERKSDSFGPELTAEFRRAVMLFAFLTVPIWVFILTTGAGPLRWLERPGLGALREFVSALTGNAGWALALAYVVVISAAFSRRWSARGSSSVAPFTNASAALFTLAWLIVPVAVTLVVSIVKPVFLPRYLIVCLPALVLLGGAGIARLPQMAAAAVLIGMTALSLQGTANYYARDFDLLREDWRGATAYVLEQERPGDAILFHANQGRMPFEYYARLAKRPEPVIYFPGSNGAVTWRDFMGSPSLHQLQQAAANHNRVWLVLSHTNDADPATKLAMGELEKVFGSPVARQFTGVKVLMYDR